MATVINNPPPERTVEHPEVRRTYMSDLDRGTVGKYLLLAAMAIGIFSFGWVAGRNNLLEQTYIRNGTMVYPSPSSTLLDAR